MSIQSVTGAVIRYVISNLMFVSPVGDVDETGVERVRS